jgi:GDP-L-fucose synthase
MNRSTRIFIAGGTTLPGAALRTRLAEAGYGNLVGVPPEEPDLTNSGQTEDFFAEARPEVVFLVAGRSGGIQLNRDRPAELMVDNLVVTTNVLRAAHEHRVEKLLYLGSSCTYPRAAAQPLAVATLWTGPLEPTSAPYATARLAGMVLCQAYRQQYGLRCITAIAANPFGPHDDFSPEGGHVIPALLRRAHEARQRQEPTLTVWGTGTPRREFIAARDLADACLFVMRHYDGPEPINLGTGIDLSIAEVAHAVARAVDFRGTIRFDPTRPNGAPLKMLDSTPLRALGWCPSVPFASALAETYQWFLHQVLMEERTHGCAAV